MKPPIITSSPICTKARVLMLSSRDAGVGEGVGVGVGAAGLTNSCARNSPAATTVNANAKQRLIRIPPQTAPMGYSGSKTTLFAKHKNPVDVLESDDDASQRR
jgi:hypothetical protein